MGDPEEWCKQLVLSRPPTTMDVDEPEIPVLSISGSRPISQRRTATYLGACDNIDAYDREETIGEGAYGLVTRARDTRNNKMVAIKKLDPPDEKRGVSTYVMREIAILRKLHHENVISLIDIAVSDDRLEDVYMVMEICPMDLTKLIYDSETKLSLGEVKCVAKQLLAGLAYIHGNNIMHRDIKPHNILITANGALKLADFGMARPYLRSRKLTSQVITLWYRAPEVLSGRQDYTHAVDIWSAGLVIGEMIWEDPVVQGSSVVRMLISIANLLDIEPFNPELASELFDRQLDSDKGIRKRFLDCSTEGTVKFLSGLLSWNPSERWTAAEILGLEGRVQPSDAEFWLAVEEPKSVGEKLTRKIESLGRS